MALFKICRQDRFRELYAHALRTVASICCVEEGIHQLDKVGAALHPHVTVATARPLIPALSGKFGGTSGYVSTSFLYPHVSRSGARGIHAEFVSDTTFREERKSRGGTKKKPLSEPTCGKIHSLSAPLELWRIGPKPRRSCPGERQSEGRSGESRRRRGVCAHIRSSWDHRKRPSVKRL